MKKCGECELFHNGCDFSETKTDDNDIKEFVACGQFMKKITEKEKFAVMGNPLTLKRGLR